jgi:hypothetical protein
MKLPEYKDFKESTVAFVDILGFDKRIRSIDSENKFFEISKLSFALKKHALRFRKENKIFNGFELTAVSDCLIISVPYENEIATYGLLSILHTLQYELIATSFKTLVRGFITKGKVYHKNGILFGEGYSNAYKSESQLGGPPRIVVSPEITSKANITIEDAQEKQDIEIKTIFDLLTKDPSDGLYFIDYLNPVGTQSLSSKEQLRDEMLSVKDFILEQVDSSDQNINILQKYNWLNWYYLKSSE